MHENNGLQRGSIEYVEILAEVFAEIVRKAVKSTHDTKRTADVTPALMECLNYVFLHGPSGVGRIAGGLSISMPAASQLVERLVRRGLATRQDSDKDRRSARVELTDAGRELVAQAREDREKWFRNIWEKLPSDIRTRLVECLEEFISVALTTEQDVDNACVKCGIEHLAFCILNKAHVAATGEPVESY